MHIYIIEFWIPEFVPTARPARAYPIWPMELYAISLFKFFWPIAATAPKIIDANDKKIIIICHWSIKLINGTYKNLINTVNAATLGTIAKNKVTDVGEPSYTSGAHIWKGTADILNDRPTRIKTSPKTLPVDEEKIFSEIILKFVDPVKPYIKEHPYNNRPEDKALSTKYFKPASDDWSLFLLNAARTYNDKDWSSNPI